jgi:hypothetical protein
MRLPEAAGVGSIGAMVLFRSLLLTSLAVWLCGAANAQGVPGPDERRNWFDDPFFQVSEGLAACPRPLGPLLTFDEQRREAHWRAERGTSCWLAGACSDSNAYRYDKALAPKVAQALLSVPGVAGGSSVWVTVQRRWVFLEGCVSSTAQARALERAARQVPDVETVVPMLSVGTRQAPRYPIAPR